MRITRVRAHALSVPIPLPLREGTVGSDCVVVVIETDDGAIGYGACSTRELASSTTAFIDEIAAPFLLGADPRNTERIWELMLRRLNIRGQGGVWSVAMSAIDVALWDLKGKHFGVPVHTLLGGAHSRLPVYVTFGFAEYSTEELVEIARSLVAEGHRGLKMIVGGYRDPRVNRIDDAELDREHDARVARDAERVWAVRDAIGPDVDLMLDANYTFTYSEALRLCELVADARPAWFEEPVRMNDHRLLAALRQHTAIPIAAGQELGHLWAHRELVVAGAVDIVQPNVCMGGGFTEAVRVAALARAFNLPIAVGGGWQHHNMHLHGGLAGGGLVEFHWLSWRMAEALYGEVPVPRDGWVALSDAPGLGLDLLDDALERFEVRGDRALRPAPPAGH